MSEKTDNSHPMDAYQRPEVQLIGENGNAFAIMARTGQALRQAGVPDDLLEQYYKEAKSGDYDNLLRVTMEWTETPETE